MLKHALAQQPGQHRVMARLGVVSVVAAQLESMVFVLIAVVAGSLGSGQHRVMIDFAGLRLQVGIGTALAATAFSIVAAAAVSGVFVMTQSRAAAAVDRMARDGVFLDFARADWDYQARQRAGGLQGRLRLAQQAVRQFNALTNWLRASAMVAVFVTVSILVDPLGALVIGAMGAVLALVIVPLRRATRVASRSLNEVEYRYGEELTDVVQQASDLRVFSAWPAVEARMEALSTPLQALRERTAALAAATPLVYQYGGLLVIAGLLLVVLLLGGSDGGGLATLAAVGLLLLRSVQYGQAVQSSLQVVSETSPALDILYGSLAAPAPSRANGTEQLDSVDEVELRGVSYTYPDQGRPALVDVDLRLPVGSMVGVVGPSGGGKSTLAQILLRLREPIVGQLLVDGRPAGTVSEQAWFSKFSHVPQQPHLIHGSLRDNVTFLDERLSDSDVERAVLDAGLADLLESLPDGLETPIGTGQRDLSGGQVQRVGLARALVRSPAVIVLDEPTSALDPTTERVVHDTLRRLRTVRRLLIVVIAHRETTLALCDHVLTLHEGRVVRDLTAPEVRTPAGVLR